MPFEPITLDSPALTKSCVTPPLIKLVASETLILVPGKSPPDLGFKIVPPPNAVTPALTSSGDSMCPFPKSFLPLSNSTGIAVLLTADPNTPAPILHESVLKKPSPIPSGGVNCDCKSDGM